MNDSRCQRLRDTCQMCIELFNGSWALDLGVQAMPVVTADWNCFNLRSNARTKEFDNQDGAGILIEVIRLRSASVMCPRSHLFAAVPIAKRQVIQTRLISARVGDHIVLLRGRSEPIS